MDTIAAIETVVAEETSELKPGEIVEIALSDLDCVAGGSSIGTNY